MRFFKLYILQNEVNAFSQPGFMSIFKPPNITMFVVVVGGGGGGGGFISII